MDTRCNKTNFKLYVTLSIIAISKVTNCMLLYPSSTVLQLSWCLVTPLELPFPNPSFIHGRIAINRGFQFNYNMPFTVKEFYNPNYWVLRTFNRNFMDLIKSYMPPISTNSNINSTYTNDTTVDGSRDKRDLSAGQLYTNFENTLESHGFNRECLKKSICEMAKDPLYRFDEHDKEHERDLFLDVIHFLLTPSVHDAFHSSELEERTFYEEAELIGHNDGDCNKFYAQCDISPLEIVTHKIEQID